MEPSAAYLNFRDNALYRDTWMLGLSAGVDFTSLIGVRGFYYRNTKDADKLSFNTNSDLSIYGANLVTRLNSGRGLTPYFTLGAGYINAGKSYVDRNGNTGTTDNGWFALGGVGLDLYLHRNVSLFGAAEAMLLNNDNPKISAISDPAKVNVNWMYRAGVRINIAQSGRSGVEAYHRYSDARVAAEHALGQEALRKQRSAYDERIAQLDAQLKEAAERLDTAQVRLIASERASVETERTRSNTAETTVEMEKTTTQTHQRVPQWPNHARSRATSSARLWNGANHHDRSAAYHRRSERSPSAILAQAHRRDAAATQQCAENADRSPCRHGCSRSHPLCFHHD